MYVRGQRVPEGTSTLMERPERVGEVIAGERLGRGGCWREGRRRTDAGPGLCAEGGWRREVWQRVRRLKVAVLW